VVDNACGSVAVVNILMNIPDVELGANLSSFKEFTKDMTPAMRGYTLANFDFLRQIHNSSARYVSI
jgi:ubiquitin carboxyl-terminal hydrolase L5